ncbi:5-methyltetrahydropteroyltriglutamate--homocysteine methyltransferase [Pleodorina starrii]|nr:5-methyltetrahydropteroyltriglutamate--homocysteine methyltransferase [Pleodorina starrii]
MHINDTVGLKGFPRTGPNREIKVALESYWKGQSSEEQLLRTAHRVEADAWRLQKSAGIEAVGLDGTLYDQVLDTITWLGVVPPRFKGLMGLRRYFAMARGAPGCAALDMSKFFDTNYHYLVPELDADLAPAPDFAPLLDKLRRGQEALGSRQAAVPIVIGPVTFVCLAKGCPLPVGEAVGRLLPAYCQLLRLLGAGGATEVQLHEPILTTSTAEDLQTVFQEAYGKLAEAASSCPSSSPSPFPLSLHLVTYYDDLGSTYPWAVQLPVAAISLDLRGATGAEVTSQTMQHIRRYGFPYDKRLGAGVVDGRSVWADDGTALALIRELLPAGLSPERLIITSSAPLQHLPYDLAAEGDHVPPELSTRLAFAVQRVDEIVRVAEAVRGGQRTDVAVEAPTEEEAPSEKAAGEAAAEVPSAAVGQAAAAGGGGGLRCGLPAEMFSRSEPYDVRRGRQVQMPAFPTTTIGSFPQTPEVRRLRQQLRSGQLSQSEYERRIAGHIAHCVGVQEALGVDVVVHGEAERTDMVEYFGSKLGGMWFTVSGWVQSYGSRYVRPPLIVSDITYQGPMTVWEYGVAQSYTRRPVKGMLTGPVTILNWSFPRKDISRARQALQLALALRKEVEALEGAGCSVVQVDEPALREGLPLKRERWSSYLGWAVDAFRLCTAVAAPGTQVVTHLCYSDFEDILHDIARMDADVLTIENSRSGNAMISALAAAGYSHDIGPGVYDVHSPEVPSVDFIRSRIRSFVETGILGGRADRIWVNPDCGLKTRGWPETIAALRNMVAAAAQAPAELLLQQQQQQQPQSVVPGVATAAAADTASQVAGNGSGGRSGGCNGCCH